MNFVWKRICFAQNKQLYRDKLMQYVPFVRTKAKRILEKAVDRQILQM